MIADQWPLFGLVLYTPRLELRVPAGVLRAQGRDQPRVPVVAMEDLGPHLEEPDRLQDRAVEEHEPLAVVGIILPAFLLIEVGAIEELGLIDQVDLDARARQRRTVRRRWGGRA